MEQTEQNMRDWLKKLGFDDTVGVHILMGGEDSGEWDIYPERPAILIGTQDMLLQSRLEPWLRHEPLPLADTLRIAQQ